MRKRVGVAVALLGILCFLTVWQRVYVGANLREIGRLRKQLEELELENEEREATLTKLKSFEEIRENVQKESDFIFPDKIVLDIPEKYATLVEDKH